MLDFTDLLKRFTSRLLIGFVITIWACVNYFEIIDPWIFVSSFGIFAIVYGLVKMYSFHTGVSTNGEVNDIKSDIIDERGVFKSSEIRGS